MKSIKYLINNFLILTTAAIISNCAFAPRYNPLVTLIEPEPPVEIRVGGESTGYHAENDVVQSIVKKEAAIIEGMLEQKISVTDTSAQIIVEGVFFPYMLQVKSVQDACKKMDENSDKYITRFEVYKFKKDRLNMIRNEYLKSKYNSEH